ncbi:PAS domain-containing protein [Halostella sp. JP-L12]|uniref:sensor histidine kinase n=1 Tax=Halostella TaxID=1843185 RepID=UPI000EF7C7A6|nr:MULTISPECIES: PAS domain-containing sensor histidine kinase [Halostella]NHN46860.1 PAS domain-containing protein [Halostella sp. JP-L12]
MNGPPSLEEAALDALPSQVAVLESDGTIAYTNRAWDEFAAENDAATVDFVGENYLAVCDADADVCEASDGIRAVLAGDRESFEYEYPCHTPDEPRWFTMRAVRFVRGDAAHALVMHVDITERKIAEMEVNDRNDRLKTVASVLSHDLRNPLTVAMGELDLLERETDADPARTGAVRHALDRIGSIVEDSLVFLRRDEADPRPVDLRHATEEAWASVDAGEATLAVAETPAIRADPTLLGHVLENLLGNAVKHGGDAAAVRVGPIDGESGDAAGFFVADDGPGVPDADRDRVFEYGYTTGGTGLGLAIVERTAEMHGWSVDVAEGEAGGARFEITGVETVG